MKVVAVVVTHNRPHLLSQCIDSLQMQSYRPASIIIIDNASGEETQKLLTRYADLLIHRTEENIGGAGGFSVGIKIALETGADWVWLLDDDAIPTHNALEELLRMTPKENKIGALCSAVHEFGAIAPTHRRYFNPTTLHEAVISPTEYKNTPIKIDTGSFVGFLLNATAAREVGLPHQHFFLAYDDTEYSLRLILANWSIWLIPTSLIDHRRHSKSRMRHGPFEMKHYYNLRNQLAVFRHYGHAPKWRLWIPIIKFAALALSDRRISSIKLWIKSIKDSKKITL